MTLRRDRLALSIAAGAALTALLLYIPTLSSLAPLSWPPYFDSGATCESWSMRLSLLQDRMEIDPLRDPWPDAGRMVGIARLGPREHRPLPYRDVLEPMCKAEVVPRDCVDRWTVQA